ncbi:MAG: hypothetical protein GY868_13035 [Deltaproteobacteria bacterium]|nr:hypothetical protein [Deltaproteobacteria bacterium]
MVNNQKTAVELMAGKRLSKPCAYQHIGVSACSSYRLNSLQAYQLFLLTSLPAIHVHQLTGLTAYQLFMLTGLPA